MPYSSMACRRSGCAWQRNSRKGHFLALIAPHVCIDNNSTYEEYQKAEILDNIENR